MEPSNEFFGTGWWNKPSPFTLTGAWQTEDEPYAGDYSKQETKPELPVQIKCSDKECNAFITVGNAAKEVKYTCRLHTEKSPDEVRFQRHQFDRTIDHGGSDEEE